MKKIISTLLIAAMLLSMVIIVSVPAAAADGEWTTYASPDTYGVNEDGTPKEPVVAGYEYTAEGFTTIDADWTGRAPFVTVQTKNKVNIQEGVYLKVCVDRYAYEGNDAWINLNIWDSQNIKPGEAGYGQGVQTLIRPDRADSESQDWYYSKVQWWVGEWENAGDATFKDADGKDTTVPVVDGKVTFELELKYEAGAYKLTINGAEAPNAAVAALSRLFTDNEAYIGITLKNTTYDSTVGLTILEFGTSKEDARTPEGDDDREPQNAAVEEIAEIADASTVAAGQPAIIINGNKEASDMKSIAAGQGDTYTIDDDYTVRVNDTNGDRWNSTDFKVKNDVSYDIDDFPVMMFLTKNFCTCADPEACYATEDCNVYIMAGKGRAPASGGCVQTSTIDVCWDPIFVGEGDNADSYLYFWYDTSSETALDYVGGEGSNNDWTGRIHGVQMEFSHLSTDPARNVISIVWVAFFRTVEEGEAYVLNYLGVSDDTPADEETTAPADEETTAPADEETTAPAGEETTAPAGEETTAPVVDVTTAPAGEETTEAKGEETTKPKNDKVEDDEDEDEDEDDDKGCGSVIGAGAAAVVALVALGGAVVLRKKED